MLDRLILKKQQSIFAAELSKNLHREAFSLLELLQKSFYCTEIILFQSETPNSFLF